jgi:formylglycine-generating enzyme required for sulfatase activity
VSACPTLEAKAKHAPAPIGAMRRIEGGVSRMRTGNGYPREAPAHTVTVGGFWIDEFAVTKREFIANTWQGVWPFHDQGLDGFAGRSPVGSFPPNGYGLYDMIGHVWEWTTDWYSDRRSAKADASRCILRTAYCATREAGQLASRVART